MRSDRFAWSGPFSVVPAPPCRWPWDTRWHVHAIGPDEILGVIIYLRLGWVVGSDIFPATVLLITA
ncbi:MAG: hypothetical protein OXT72_06130 [Gammaproteobacteria bacterium]|nr:hypothetical protein [Gammaproteobacteria bacterium]MDE0249130.1 hypothetical protein [Gammaproteobacteria bacterium]